MKRLFRILSIAALAVVGAMGCTSLETPCQEAQSGVVTMTATIGLDAGSDTKALTAAGVKTFAPGDRIAVFYEFRESSDGIRRAVSEALTAGDISADGKNATFTVTFINPMANGFIRYVYPADMALSADYYPIIDDKNTIDFTRLVSQNGTLESLAAGLDLAVYDGILNASKELPLSATLQNRLCIGEFNIKNGGGSLINNELVRLTVSDGTNSYTVNRSASADPFYVAMLPMDNKTVSIFATDGQNCYTKQVNSVSLACNNLYPINIIVAPTDDRSTPLTFEAIAAGTVTFYAGNSSISVQYRKDKGSWTDYSEPVSLSVGEKVSFRGNNATYCTVEGESYFSCSADCYLYGNIMSLVNASEYATATSLMEESTFSHLFENDRHIISHASKPLLLPATVLTNNCYGNMFRGCSGLTIAPALPATTLTTSCYANMFMGCTRLTTAPALPATTLSRDCYFSMFRSCERLVTAPELPAEELKRLCYGNMFQDCTSLSAAPALPATTLANDCYSYMFDGCSSLVFAPALPATTLTDFCYQGMFGNCTNLYVAPELPATTLTVYCYDRMFQSCRSLSTAPALPATKLAVHCYECMFYNCFNLKEAPALPATELADHCYSEMFTDCDLLTTTPTLPALTLVKDCYDNMFRNCDQLNNVVCMALEDISGNTDNWLSGVAVTGTFTTYLPEVWPEGPSGIPTGWDVYGIPIIITP